MSMKLKFYGGIMGLGVLAYGYSMADRSMNYVETKAIITAVQTDCYIESGRTKIVEKDTDKMAYMDCAMAPMVAKQYDMDESAIRYRSRLKFAYRSPVDGSVQNGEYTDSHASKGRYTKDGEVTIYAHTKEAAEYRWN